MADRPSSPDPGLCRACVQALEIRNKQGSRFTLCRRSRSDPRYPRYPPLPVRACPGFQARGADP